MHFNWVGAVLAQLTHLLLDANPSGIINPPVLEKELLNEYKLLQKKFSE